MRLSVCERDSLPRKLNMEAPLERYPVIIWIVLVAVCVRAQTATSLERTRCVDLLRVSNSSGTKVVLSTVELIQKSNVFSNDHGFLRNLAHVESFDGTSSNSYDSSTHGGIWRIRREILDEIDCSDDVKANIYIHFGLRWSSVQWNDLRKPLVSAIAAMLYINSRSTTINLRDISVQASEWAHQYNGNGNYTIFFHRLSNITTPKTDSITQRNLNEDFQILIKASQESAYIHIPLPPETSVILLNFSAPLGEVTLYISPVIVPSEVFHCGSITTSTSQSFQVSAIQQPYRVSGSLYITVVGGNGSMVRLTSQGNDAVLPFLDFTTERSIAHGLITTIDVPSSVTIDRIEYDSVSIKRTGAIILAPKGKPFDIENPPKHLKTFAPYSINSADTGPGYVSYAIVEDSNSVVVQRVQRYLAYGHNLVVTISWIFIVEWRNVCPDFDSSCFYEKPNTFQTVLVSSSASIFVIFTYRCGMINWGSRYKQQRPIIGYVGRRYHPYSHTPSAVDIDCINHLHTEWSNTAYELYPTPPKCAQGEVALDATLSTRSTDAVGTVGLLEVCIDSEYHYVCDSQRVNESLLLSTSCHYLGYRGESQFLSASIESNDNSVISKAKCPPNATKPADCQYSVTSEAQCAVVLCATGKASFKLADVQSMNRSGYNVSTGSVLYCTSGQCKPVCSSAIKHNEATLICHSAYGNYEPALSVNIGKFSDYQSIAGASGKVVTDLGCPDDATTVDECSSDDIKPSNNCSLHGGNAVVTCIQTNNGHCYEGEINLEGSRVSFPTGRHQRIGKVQVCHNSTYVDVDSSIVSDVNITNIVCINKLQLSVGEIVPHTSEYGASGRHLTNIKCGQSPFPFDDFSSCLLTSGQPRASTILVIKCEKACTHGKVRVLEKKQYRQYSMSTDIITLAGVLEVCVNNHWATICQSATVSSQFGPLACRELGYSNGSLSSNSATMGISTSSLALSSVSCTRGLLSSCVFSTTESSECLAHSNDMRLTCTNHKDESVCSADTLNYSSAATGTFINRTSLSIYSPSLCHMGQLYAICAQTSLDEHTATLMCHQLKGTGYRGYPRAVYGSVDDFNPPVSAHAIASISCPSQLDTFTIGEQGCSINSSASLMDCTGQMLISCFKQKGACPEGAVRLSGSTDDVTYDFDVGRPEVCIDGEYVPFCNNAMTYQRAVQICLDLYSQASYVLTYPFIGNTSQYDTPQSNRGVVNISCSKSSGCEYDLSNRNEECLNHGSHSVITCFRRSFAAMHNGSCTNGTVRLIHSIEAREHNVVLGYLYLCVNGSLMPVHVDSLISSNMTMVSNVACRELGYQGSLRHEMGWLSHDNHVMAVKHIACKPDVRQLQDCAITAGTVLRTSDLKYYQYISCAMVDCGAPEVLDDGSSVEYSGTGQGSIATYSCKVGYEMSGEDTRRCLANSTWDGAAPHCLKSPVNCSQLQLNGANMILDYTDSNAVYYSCSLGYVLLGSSIRRCQNDGTWSGTTPTCTNAVNCGVPSTTGSGLSVAYNSTDADSLALYACDWQYEFHGREARTCQLNSTWSESSPYCEVIDCGVPSTTNNTKTISYNGTYRGDVVHYTCETGYTLVGTSTRVCLSNRQWSGAPPLCQVPPFLSNYAGVLMAITEVGGKVAMNCTARGVPSPTILWRKDKQLLVNSSSFSIVSKSGQVTGGITGLLETSSTLTVTNIRESHSGLYRCRAESAAGSAILTTPYNLSIATPTIDISYCKNYEITHNGKSVCQNGGTCIDLVSGYYRCQCPQGYHKENCQERVLVEIVPTIQGLYVTTASVNQAEVPAPYRITGQLHDTMSILCLSYGSPQPSVVWYKNGDVYYQGSTLSFDALHPDDRGVYYCNVTNTLATISSQEVLLNISGIFQYKMFVSLLNRDALSEDDILQIQDNVTSELLGSKIYDDYQVFSIEINPIQNHSDTQVSLIITLLSEAAQFVSSLVLESLRSELADINTMLPNLVISTDSLIRYDGCVADVTIIPSQTNDSNLELEITWPETNIGVSITAECPCNNLQLSSSILQSARRCGGGYKGGGEWDAPVVSACNFSDALRQVCELAEADAADIVDRLQGITEQSADLDTTEITVAVAVLLLATANSSGNITLSEDFLTVVDNIASADSGVLEDSLISANTSARLLEAVNLLIDSLPVGDELVVIPQNTFTVSARLVRSDDFEEKGQFIAASIDNRMVAIVGDDIASINTTVSVELPGNLVELLPNTSNTSVLHLSTSFFTTDSLFLRQNNNGMEVASIIASVRISGAYISELDEPPVRMRFSRDPMLVNGSDPVCVFWDPSLNSGYGDWSTEGCRINETASTDDTIECLCDHLTSFSILLDTSPDLQFSDFNSPTETGLSAISYIGVITSAACLLVTIVSYLALPKLHHSDHGKMLLNLCFGLLGLYLTFVVAIHSSPTPALCAIVAALLQYFLLVVFLASACEATNLYMKLVIVVGKPISNFALKSIIVTWVVPAIVVPFCIAPDYENYISAHFCRAYNLPFYIGLIVPFALVYIFNWVVFIVIISSLVRTRIKSKFSDSHRFMSIRQHLIIAMTLSVLFGLGWGTGVAASYRIYSTVTKHILSTIFICCTAFDGLFIFVMHCVRSKDVRALWRGWLKRTKVEDVMSSFISHGSALSKTVRTAIGTKETKSSKDHMTTPIIIRNEMFSETGRGETECASTLEESTIMANNCSSVVNDSSQPPAIHIYSESEHTLERYKV